MHPTYTNPILNADWSDPDVIRVGDAYYMTASTFNRVPGLPILRSSDLVNWEIIGHALQRLVPERHFDLPRHGGGVWAPALRYHDDRFFIVYPDPDHGFYVVHSEDPAGPWSEPHLLYAGRGLIDPCPFWDDDGRAYLVHAWATTRAGINNVLTLHEITPDAAQVLGPSRTVVDGFTLAGFSVLEGPKLYKRDGWYWIFAPAGGVPEGWQSVFRSRSIWGPYEERTTLAQGSSPVNGPHQGAWVEAVDGSHWFLHFQDRGPVGRVVHLQPMSWSEDGWPQMGTNWDGHLGDRQGEPVLSHEAPGGALVRTESRLERGGDWKDGIGPQWYWQANPRPDWARVIGDGVLELLAVPGDPVNLRELPNVLAQRIPGTPSQAQVAARLHDTVSGMRAGMIVLGLTYCWIGLVVLPDGDLAVVAATGGEGRSERPLAEPARLNSGAAVEMQAQVNADAEVSLAWRTPGGSWTDIEERFQATPGSWTGAHIGLFATAPHGGGHAALDTSARPTAQFGRFSLQRDH